MPRDEAARLATLHNYAILNSAPEEAFDRITRVVAHLLDVPMAFVTFIEPERVWFKSTFGVDLNQCARNGAFCDLTIKQDCPLVVRDATLDPRFSDNPFVSGPAGIRFYAGAPLQAPGGFNLGTLCVFDTKPRELSEEQLRILEDLASVVVDQLELRRATKRAVTESEQRFRDFASATSDWFWEMDEDLRFSYFSDRMTAVVGIPESELLGKRREETGVGPFVDPKVWQDHLDDLAAHRPFRNFVHPRIRPDGEEIWLSISGAPYFDEAGVFKGYRGTGTDITQRFKAEAALRKSDRAKSEFLAAMSHELRTPLNAILGFSEVIRKEIFGPIGSPRYNDYLQDIHSSGTHLLGLINDILDLSKIESGTQVLHEEEIDVLAIIHSVRVLVEQHACQRRIDIAVDVPDRLPPLRADGQKLKQILVNLLINSIKFSVPDGVVSLRACCPADGGHVFRIADQGIGIAQDDIPKAFERFGQVDSASNREQEGTGLGLPIATAFAEMHGGTLSLESEVGVGTTVTVRFPPERVVGLLDR